MKKYLPAAIFFFLFQSGFAQNWSVINLSDKFNYRLDNDPIITATIWADSVEVNGNDSVFYLNRIMCDTCVTIIGGPNPCDTCYAARNRPQFFQRQADVSVNGIINFRDSGNIVLNMFAQLNDSWLFDSTWNISATVIALGMDSVFGNYDSVKTILLSSGDTIIISKNFGALQFPRNYGQNSYYKLAGIEGRNLGEQVPKFADFFDFDVGDMFEYHKTGNNSDCFFDDKRKYTISSKQVYPDSIVYGIEGINRYYEWPIGWWGSCASYPFIDSFTVNIVYRDSTKHFINTYFKSAFNLANQAPIELYIPDYNWDVLPCANNDSAYDRTNIFLDSNQVFSKSFGIAFKTWTLGNEYYYHYTELNYSDTLYIDASSTGEIFFGYSSTYKVGLGLTDYVLSNCFEGIDIDHMVAYSKGGDTVGVFTPDSILLLAIDHPIQQQFDFYPNPASSTIFISNPFRSPTEISLNDIEGKILITKSIKDLITELDVGNIEPGLYFLIIKSSEGIFSKKVLIQH